MSKGEIAAQLIEKATPLVRYCADKNDWIELWAEIGHASWEAAHGAKVTIIEVNPEPQPETKPPSTEPSRN
jgi:hypothetical protein